MAIKLDPNNARLHNDLNKGQINTSLKDLGAGRSIVIDNENYIIAGNGVFEQAEELGIKTKVIESDGSELIVVKRTDLKYNDALRRKLAIADNATAETSEWDFEELTEEEIQEWGIEGVILDEYDTAFSLPDGGKPPFQQITFTLADAQAERVKDALAEVKEMEEYKYCETMGNENSNGNALYLIIMQWAKQKKFV